MTRQVDYVTVVTVMVEPDGTHHELEDCLSEREAHQLLDDMARMAATGYRVPVNRPDDITITYIRPDGIEVTVYIRLPEYTVGG